MKKLLYTLTALSLSLGAVACSDDDDDNPITPVKPEVVPDNSIPNIQRADFQSTGNTNDPRGTYFINSPHYYFPWAAIDTVEISASRAQLIIEGSSPTQGTYKMLVDSLIESHVLYETEEKKMRITQEEESRSIGGANKDLGTWRVENGKFISTTQNGSVTEYTWYSSTSKGLFLYDAGIPLISRPRVRIWKRQ